MAKKNNKSKAKAKATPVRARDATDPRSNARFNFVSDELFDFSAAPRECAEARDGGSGARRDLRASRRGRRNRAPAPPSEPRAARPSHNRKRVRLASLRPADVISHSSRRRCVFSRSRPRPTTRRPSPRRRPARRPPSGLRRRPPRSPPVWPSTVPVRPSPTRRRGATIREHPTALLSTFGARDVRATFELEREDRPAFLFLRKARRDVSETF